jgi:hypothetical protein
MATIPTLAALMDPVTAAQTILSILGGDVAGGAPVHIARLASTANVTLSSVSTTLDGKTIVAGDRILFKDQSTHSQNGIYIAGTVSGGNAPMTRAPEMASATDVQSGLLVAVSEGTAGANTVWQMTTAGWPGAKVLGTDTLDFGLVTSAALSSSTPAAIGTTAAIGVGATAARADHVHIYPAAQYGTVVLVAGTATVSTAAVTANSRVFFTRTTSNTTTLTLAYACTTKTPGAPGSFVVQAQVAAGTLNNADISTLDWFVVG